MTNTLWTWRSVLLLGALLFATANAAGAASSASLAGRRESGLPAQSVLALVPAAGKHLLLLFFMRARCN